MPALMEAPITIPKREAVDFRWYSEKYLTTEKGQPLDFRQRTYLHDIYDCVAPEMILMKSAQVGISGWAVNKALWLADNMALTVIYVLPTKSAVGEFSQARFNPIATNSKIRKRMEVDNVKIKHIGNSFIYFRGSSGEQDALTVPADCLMIDEYDKCQPDVVEAYNERLSASVLKLKFKYSTPTIPNYGIHALWEKSDQREWFCKCKRGHEQQLSVDKIDYEMNEFRCERTDCGEPIDRMGGRWIAQKKSDLVGFHPTQLMCWWISPREIIQKRNDYEFPADFYNFVVGVPYAGGVEAITRADVLACLVESVPVNNASTLGVDWGNESWWVVRKPGRIVAYGKITGDTRTHAGQVLDIRDKFKCSKIIPDFGYGDTKNKELVDNSPKDSVYWCIYTDDGKDLFPKFNAKENKVNVDRTRSLQLRMMEIKENRVLIQQGLPSQEDFILHHTNLFEKKEKDDHGEVRLSIEKKGPDHLAHANNYAALPEIKRPGAKPQIIIIGETKEEKDDE